MASMKKPLLRKLETELIRQFPSPAKVKLQDVDGIIGVITSDRFAGMDPIDRQTMIGKIVEKVLDLRERRQVQVIVGVTPYEGDGYLAGVD